LCALCLHHEIVELNMPLTLPGRRGDAGQWLSVYVASAWTALGCYVWQRAVTRCGVLWRSAPHLCRPNWWCDQ
jgi:hypothetical protein